MNKSELRKELIIKRDNITRRESAEKIFFERFIKSDFYKNARNIMIYSAIKSEVGTNSVIEKMLADKKTVILPRVIKFEKLFIFNLRRNIHGSKDEFVMLPIKINAKDDLKIGSYGISEPVSDVIFPKKDIEIILVPGIAFDEKNNRLGYGAGYYDRFLADVSALKIGVCYKETLIKELPNDKYDIKMDFIIVC